MSQEALHIKIPDELALRNAYRGLPRGGGISIHILLGDLAGTLNMLESIGFVGIKIVYINPSSDSADLKAYKGKNGPCYNTGRIAVYEGAALAALDDDNHLLFANTRTPVCEKTAQVYKLPAYDKQVKCSEADPALKFNSNHIPEIFSCGSFEDDLEELSKRVKGKQREKEHDNLFYPGPFRLLILNDGRVIKRGQNVRISKSDARQLMKSDGLFRLENFKTGQPVFFQELYESFGSRCLLDNNFTNEIPGEEIETDFSKLGQASAELKDRMLKLISQDKKYFILTGSDFGDTLGCCPSEIVTDANKLTRAGILVSYNQPASEDTCPVTIYAFKNEIKVSNNELQFSIDHDFRQLVFERLQNKKHYSLKVFTRWILLSFIVVSLALALFRFFDSSPLSTGLSLYEQLIPENKNQQMVILFHYSERCEMCLSMEKYTREVLKEDFSGYNAEQKLQFKLITIDTPENLNLVERFDLYTSTIVLIKFENKKETKVSVLKDSWKYYGNETLFKNMLRSELNQFMNNKHE